MTKPDAITQNLLAAVADLHDVPSGAYNLRLNGDLAVMLFDIAHAGPCADEKAVQTVVLGFFCAGVVNTAAGHAPLAACPPAALPPDKVNRCSAPTLLAMHLAMDIQNVMALLWMKPKFPPFPKSQPIILTPA